MSFLLPGHPLCDDLIGGMNLPKFTVQIALLGLLLLLPIGVRALPSSSSLADQLARARADKDNASVVEICRRQLAQTPGDLGVLQEMFRAQLELKDTDRAAETLALLDKTRAPTALRAELRGDLAHAGHGTLDDAVAAWREALTAKPADAPAILGKIADALDDAGSPDAVDALRVFLRVKPDHAARTARLAVWLLTTGHPDEADKTALAANRLDAADDTVKAVAPVFDRLRPQLPALRKLSARSGLPGIGPDPRLDRAFIYYRAGAYDAALPDGRAILADAKERNVAARVVAGQCFWRLGKEKEAAALRVANLTDTKWFDDPRHCERLRAPDELPPDTIDFAFVRAHAARAMTLLDANQPVLALDDAETAIRAEEKTNHHTADTEVVLAAVLLRNDRPADALAAARRATVNDPRNPDGWALCGRLEQEAADFPAAVDSLSRALAIREDIKWLHRRETCLRTMGRNADADRDAQRAAQLPTASS